MGLLANAKNKMDARLKAHEVSDEMLRAFIGQKTDYYLGARDKATTWGWHWAAFFFTLPWLAYRKQYWVLALFIVLGLIPNFGSVPYVTMIFLAVVQSRYFYYFWAHETVWKINQKTADPLERGRLYAKKGGVSKILATIFAILIVVQSAWHEYLVWTHQIPNPIAVAMNQANS